jgi:hypothetical protein
VADEICLGQTFTSVAAAIICKILTEKVVMGLLLPILWGNTSKEWLNMPQNDFLGMISDTRNGYMLQR